MSDDLDLDAAEYVLGTLDATEREAFARRLAQHDRAAQTAVAAWEARFSGLADDVTPIEVPAHLWPKIERALSGPSAEPLRFKVIQGGATADSTAGLRRSLKRWRIGAFVSTAVAAAALVFIGVKLSAPVADTTFIAAVNRGGDQPALIVRVDLKTQTVYVRPVAAEAPAGKSLELWYISDGKAPRSMGVVQKAPLSMKLPAGTDAAAATFAISVEPLGGSPSGVATGPVIYSGQLVRE